MHPRLCIITIVEFDDFSELIVSASLKRKNSSSTPRLIVTAADLEIR